MVSKCFVGLSAMDSPFFILFIIMTATEARQKALNKQKNRWSKLPLEVRTSIRESVKCGQLHCIVNTRLNNIE